MPGSNALGLRPRDALPPPRAPPRADDVIVLPEVRVDARLSRAVNAACAAVVLASTAYNVAYLAALV